MFDEKEIGEIVRILRGNTSLRDFAEKCDVSHTTIDYLEKGIDFRTQKPIQVKISTLQKISEACDFPIEGFISGLQENGNRLKIVRKCKNQTLTQVIENLGIPAKKYLIWEIPTTSIDNNGLQKLSEYFKVDTHFISGEDYEMTIPFEEWRKDEQEDYENASPELKIFLEFCYGKPKYYHKDHQELSPQKQEIQTALDGMSPEQLEQVKSYILFIKSQNK